jgi:tRNAThr (cytosine32-N3)-methyltransferase
MPLRKPATETSKTNDQKRADPFQFGSRYLEEGDDIFAHNAWDHVETDEAYKAFIEEQAEFQRNAPVSDFDKRRFNESPEKFWNKFYSNNRANFFKDRKWLIQEFPILGEVVKPDYGPATVLEVGAGAGNTAFPILANNQNKDLRIHACDYSKTAIEVIRSNEAYDGEILRADVWDVAGTGENALPPRVEPQSVDVVVMIFIFSALQPTQWLQAVKNVYNVLKPGGIVLFRDYGRGDLAQVRFKKGRYLEENFYIRGDGTRVYFFEQEELRDIWSGNMPPNAFPQEPTESSADDVAEKLEATQLSDTPVGDAEKPPSFEITNLGVDRRMLVNRQRKLKMYRCWMQGRFQKPLSPSTDAPA